jgi:hypothetical protein
MSGAAISESTENAEADEDRSTGHDRPVQQPHQGKPMP